MFPIYTSRFSNFNYENIPPGYYYYALTSKNPIQRFWHQKRSETVAERISEDSRVLDLGCGPGTFLLVLAQLKKQIVGVGVDIATPQINFARKNVETQFSNHRITFQLLRKNHDTLPFENSSFDVVTCIEVLEHLHPYRASKIFKEIRRILKPQGKLVLTTPNYWSFWPLIEWILCKVGPVDYRKQHISKFTLNSLIKFLESVGFQVEKHGSVFIFAPFLSWISILVAKKMMALENRLPGHLGSLLVVEASLIDPNLLWNDPSSPR